MRSLRLFFLAVLVLALTCCARETKPPKATERAARKPDVTQVRTYRELDLALHVDVAFNAAGRKEIQAAAAAWRELSKGRVRITPIYDLDFNDIEGLKEHQARGDTVLIGVLSSMPIVEAIDARVQTSPSGRVVAATTELQQGGHAVFAIMDRIQATRFRQVLMHELGHVLGMPDLDEMGAIMSGVEVKGSTEPKGFTDADRALCRSYHYCE